MPARKKTKKKATKKKTRSAVARTRKAKTSRATKKKKPQRKPSRSTRKSTQSTPKKELDPADGIENERKAAFLVAFMDSCNVKLATRKTGVARTTPYKWAKEDDEFARAWADARPIAGGNLEDEAVRRAVTGVRKPIYQRGELVGHVQEYSDTLLIFLMKNWMPNRYLERVRNEHRGKDGGPIEHKAADRVDLSGFSVPELREYRRLVEKANAGEVLDDEELRVYGGFVLRTVRPQQRE